MPQEMSNAAIPFLAAKDSPEAAEWVGALRAAMPDERIVTFEDLNEEARSEARLAIVANPDPADLRRLPRLCWVHSVWAGVERLLADPENSRLHIVRLLDPQLAATMAEAVLAWTLFLHREMPAYARQQAQQLWQPRPYTRPQQRTVWACLAWARWDQPAPNACWPPASRSAAGVGREIRCPASNALLATPGLRRCWPGPTS
jgi:hypothetical protein